MHRTFTPDPRLPILCLAALAFGGPACEPNPTRDTSPVSPDQGEADAGFPALPSAKAKQVVTGHLHACALTTGGAVRCWGYTEYGQLGNGVVNHQPHPAIPIPVAVTGLDSGVQQISTDFRTTCALTAAGGVKCWGADGFGELGTGVPYVDSRSQISAVPVDVKGLSSGVRAISVGTSSACALTTAGGVKCWGKDEYGKLGNASTHSSGDGGPEFLPPVDVVGLSSGIKEISVGASHACALTVAGALKCWGRNGGELGIEDDIRGSYNEPQDVVALGSDVAHVYAGGWVTCVIMKDTSAKCFGDGSQGQLGDGKDGILRRVSLPVAVVGLTGVTGISNAGEYTCATVSGAVKCWGKGVIGSPDPSFRSFVPFQALDLTSGWASVSTGGSYNCLVSAEGAVKCWGANGGGTLGDGTGGVTGIEAAATPVGVVSLP